ncbi:MAG: hypothetical protein M3069_07950 [Chloroflexota bacterium]|nr:hypothetical protein [Chloroflexota bacterium]
MPRTGPIDVKRLQRRCAAQLRSLELPDRFELSAVVARVAELRARPIVLWPVANRPGPCGLWAALPGRDYVFYESDTSPMHQAHIILHELGHLIWGHQSAYVLDLDLLQSLLPDLDPGMIETVLRRARYETNEEQEAEVLASLALQRLTSGEPATTPVGEEERIILARLARSLESHDEPPQ